MTFNSLACILQENCSPSDKEIKLTQHYSGERRDVDESYTHC